MKKKFHIPNWLQNFLKVAFGATAIWILIHSGALDPKALAQAFLKHPRLCLAGFFVYLIPILLAGWLRWHLLMRNAGLKITALRSLSLHMIGIFFNTVIPGGNGGDLIKGYYLFKNFKPGEKSLALTSIAMDRLVGTYGLLVMGMAMTWVNYDLWKDSTLLRFNSFFYAGVFLLATVLIILFLSPFANRILAHPSIAKFPGGKFFSSLAQSLLVYRLNPMGLIPVLFMGFIVDCGLILLYFIFAKTLGLTVPLLVHGYVVPTLTMINGLPISPAGIGVGEAAGEVVYRNVGVTNGGSEILALVHICILIASLFGAPFYFLYRANREEKTKK